MSEQAVPVLLIEDDPGDARLIEELLWDAAGSSLKVVRADRLAGGLERLASGDFAVVVLDLALPDSRGPDTFAAVHGQAPGTPIIVLTGLGDEAIALRLVEDLLLVKVTDPHRNARLGHTNCGPPVPQKHPLVPQKHPVME